MNLPQAIGRSHLEKTQNITWYIHIPYDNLAAGTVLIA